ncbi:MAG: GAF domain-containing sensor histidine kinase [Anaerolineae bacterium]|nr:GAF domain-containing sensor histidine kinase [Anaerolineae bacterium]
MMVKMRRRFDGNALLYYTLLVLVLCSYSIPIYMGITLTIPVTSNVTTWVLNILVVAVLAATLKPVWNWVQPRVHHLVYAMDDPQLEMMGQMSDSLASTSPEESMLSTIAETIARTVKLPYVHLKTAGGTTATYGTPRNGSELTHIEITYRKEVVGWLDVASRLPKVPLSSSEYTLLNSLARQVGITLHAAHTSEALQAAREQLVLTREEERRRIRRDLHDGLGPTLASLRMQLSAARRLIRANPAEAEQLLDELRDDISTATADIRRLVYELRPPMLDELGLVVAIRNFKLGDSPMQLEVIAPEPMPRLSAAVEVAVYRIASEAIHNVVKHAEATTCVVEIQVEPGQLTLRVTDDGHYVSAGHTTGIGLHSMQERAAELGGTFSIQPATAGGACIVVHLPLES